MRVKELAVQVEKWQLLAVETGSQRVEQARGTLDGILLFEVASALED